LLHLEGEFDEDLLKFLIYIINTVSKCKKKWVRVKRESWRRGSERGEGVGYHNCSNPFLSNTSNP
jgi:hypothetical protein